MAIQCDIRDNQIHLFGDTFTVKEQIKQLGGRWNAAQKHWVMTNNGQSLEFLRSLGAQGLSPVSEGEATPQNASVLEINHSEPLPTTIVSDSSVFSVGQFVSLMQKTITAQFSQEYWITGEISSFKSSNGHCFFDLVEKDEGAMTTQGTSLRSSSLSCVIWAGRRQMLKSKIEQVPLQDGTKIKVKLTVDFRKEGSRVTGIVQDLDVSHTLGDLLLQRQSIVQELKKRGLYGKNKTTKLSRVPLRIALITAHNSRAFSDFFDELKLSQLAFQIYLFDCNVQGEQTSAQVSKTLKNISDNYLNRCDCVIVTRGGGSRLDLRWFDDLEIGKQIAYCTLPVITAVGHFDDVSIADEVAFHSEKTPTAAARFLSNSIQNSLAELLLRADQIGRVLVKRLEKERTTLKLMEERLAFLLQKRLENERKNIQRYEQLLKILLAGIQKPLERGYALLATSQGNYLSGKDFLQKEFPNSVLISMQHKESGITKKIKIHAQIIECEISSDNDE